MSTSEFGDLALSDVADVGLARWLADVRRANAPANRVLGVHRVRAAARARDAARAPGPYLPFVRNLVIGDMSARLYRPSPGPRPLVIYLHGGGFVLGSLTSHDSLCRQLARTADVAVLALDYRLAPEHPGPLPSTTPPWPSPRPRRTCPCWAATRSGGSAWPGTAPAAHSPCWPPCGSATRAPRPPPCCWPTRPRKGRCPSRASGAKATAGAWKPTTCTGSSNSGYPPRPGGLTPPPAPGTRT